MRPDLSPKSPTGPANGSGTAASNRTEKPAQSSFREALTRRDGSKQRTGGKRSEQGDANPGLLARPDGMLVVSPSIGFPEPFRANTGGRESKSTASLSHSSMLRRDVALTDVKLGGTHDSVRMHARLGEGRYTGVELRAVERAGSVSIELVARDPSAEQALRGELAQMRESLRVKGLDSVSVDVRSGEQERSRHDEREERNEPVEASRGARTDALTSSDEQHETGDNEDERVW